MQLLGIEDQVSIQIVDFDPFLLIVNEDLSRSNEDKMSSVHFLRFEISISTAAHDSELWGFLASVNIDRHCQYN